MKRTFTILLALALVLSFTVMATTPVAAQTTWYVVEGGAGDQDGTSWDDAFATIGAAVAVASAGDTIVVAAGTYTEDVTIPPALTDLTLLGANAGKSAHPHDPDGRGAESVIVGAVSIGISHGSAGITIDGFRIESGTASGVNMRGSNIKIANCVILGQDPYPTTGTTGGLRFERGGLGEAPGSFIFINNRVEGYRYGVLLDGPAAGYDASGTPSVIDGNYLRNNQRAIQTMGSVHGGTIIHEISGNTIVENQRGVRLAGGGFAIERNIISDNEDYGIQAGAGTVSMDGLTINHNCIFDNGPFGVEIDSDLDVSIDATNNWWGDASGPYHTTENPTGTGDPVSDDVDFDPWLTGLAYTGGTSFTEGDTVVLQATLSSSDNGAPGATLDFYIDGDYVGSADTNVIGVAEFNAGPQDIGTYDVTATAAGCMEVTEEIGVKAKEVVPPVGGTAYPANTLTLLAPWILLGAAIIAGATIFVRRRQAQI